MKKSKDKPWGVYIVRCNDGSLYTGISNNVESRFHDHQSQGARCAKYLRGRAPLKLVFVSVIGSKSEASKVEWEIKHYTRQGKEDLISGWGSLAGHAQRSP